MQQVNLENAKYEEFMRCLSSLKDICNDVDIQNGYIRQRTNDKATVFEFNLTPLIDDMTFPITNIKQKIDLLKIFSDQTVSIISHDADDNHANGYFTMSDEFTTLKFDGIDLEYIDNSFMPEEEKTGIFPCDESEMILSAEISNKISDRIRIIAQSFSVNTTQVKFEGDMASINVMTHSREQHARVLSELVTERELECISSLVITPFIMDHDGDMNFKMFNYQDNICSNVSETSIGDVELKVYSRSSLIEEE